ncbi:hypothetical protein E2I00_018814, partial [Balaenoptera physalus]
VRRFQCGKIGDTHIELVAFPFVGKSVIFSNLPGVYLGVAACEFTTLTTLLASTDMRHQFQHLDLQSIMEGIKNGKGRCRQDLTRNLILPTNIVENELDLTGIYLNSKSPNVGFKKKLEGSIDLTAPGLQRQLDVETAKSLLSDVTATGRIGVMQRNRVFSSVSLG